jgi:hypothetical protein
MLSIKPKRSWNRDGAVEGLPLQLIIMVVIAGVALVIILAWLAPWKSKVDLDSVSAAPGSVVRDVTASVTVTAWDTKNNKLSGVVLVLDGCGVHQSATTDKNGVATFSIKPTLAPGTTSGEVVVTATYTGTMSITKETLIIVT